MMYSGPPGMPPGINFTPAPHPSSHPPPPPGFSPDVEGPSAKRARGEQPPPPSAALPGNLIAEEKWLAKFPGVLPVRVAVPEDSTKPEWKLDGKIITVDIGLGETIAALKERIKDVVGLPANKQKLKMGELVLLDAKSLASYNVAPDIPVELSLKTRGGKK